MSTLILSREMELRAENHGRQDSGTQIQKGIKGGLPPYASLGHNNLTLIPIPL